MSIDTLNAKFLVPGAARFDEGEGGLTRLTLMTPGGAAELYLHGAHVTRFRRPHEHQILWMSEKSCSSSARERSRVSRRTASIA